MPELNPVYTELRAIMAAHAPSLEAKKDDATELYLDTRHLQKNKKPLFFGAVKLKKACVSYHLMPVYLEPSLLQGLSPTLAARMQGKSCFNFTSLDPSLLAELSSLTKAAYGSFQRQGYV